jgi:hypothetical protein
MNYYKCPNCGFAFETEPSRKRKCPSCKQQLYVIKDFYKVIGEELYKVKNESLLNPNKYALVDEYDIYSVKWAIFKSMWYRGLLINDKADNPQVFKSPFFLGEIKGFAITVKQLTELFDKFPEAEPFFVFSRIANQLIELNADNPYTISTIYTMLADLALLAKNPEAFNYHKKAFSYRLKSKYDWIYMLKDSRPISEYKAV